MTDQIVRSLIDLINRTASEIAAAKADLVGRDAIERELVRRLNGVNKRALEKLMRLLGDPPDLGNIPQSYWDTVGKETRAAIEPILVQVYLEQAQTLMLSTPSGVDWTLVNQAAADWARRYSFELVTGINKTTRDTLQSSVSAFFEQGLTIGDLETRISGAFSPVRAEMIAVTEVTRAASEGEQELARGLAEQGIYMKPVWQTNNDEIVHKCPICWPRHNQEITDGVFPPAHPRCRCWVNYEIPKP